MERQVELNLQASKNFKLCLAKFETLFTEICSIQNGELRQPYLDSEVPHFLKIFEGHRHGLDRRMDLIFNFYHALSQLENFLFPSGVKNKREQEIRHEFIDMVRTYFQTCLELATKYTVTSLEYYEFIVNAQFEKREHYKPTLYYSNNLVLRFLKDERIIIVPLIELLNIHLVNGGYNSLGKITILENNEHGIYFKREYTRWGGVGKDDHETVTCYRMNPDSLQVEKIKWEI